MICAFTCAFGDGRTGISIGKDEVAFRFKFPFFVVGMKIFECRTIISCLLNLQKKFREAALMLNTVVILINGTALLHKSTLNTNNFGNNHFGKSTRNKLF